MDGTWHLALWTNYSSPIYLLQQRCHIQRFLGRFCVSILPSITIKIDLNVFLFCLIHLHFSSLLLRVDTENILQELKTKISVIIRAYRTMFEVAQSSCLWLPSMWHHCQCEHCSSSVHTLHILYIIICLLCLVMPLHWTQHNPLSSSLKHNKPWCVCGGRENSGLLSWLAKFWVKNTEYSKRIKSMFVFLRNI